MKKTKNKIKIGDTTLLYQNEVIIKTQSDNIYSVLILMGDYLGDMLIKKVENGNKIYSYIIGIGSMRRTIGLIGLVLNQSNKDISSKYFRNDFIIKDKTIILKSLIDSQIFSVRIKNINDFEKYREYKKLFLNSSKNNFLKKDILNIITNTSKIKKYKVI